LLIALNSGLPGMATIHANSAREAITKLCTLPLLAGENVTHKFVVPTVAGCIDLVVHIGTEAGGRRVVREVLAIPGRVEGDVVERFARAGFDLTDLLVGAQTVLR
jgi:pilus assembly protein CpaF